ncbi:MAG: HK97 family phage prohead protease [Candidatus Margulisbacteria bacterium]|nr:HK97 family phage prohead protease [Candidatus Margulisiibacteriota bacterium]
MERRYTPGVIEARDDAAMTITGHAAMFDTSYDLWGFTERVARGAFKKTLNEADVAALWNHDANVVLGRNKNGTLRLAEDESGLRYEVDLPDTQAARDLFTLIKRGDVYQSSFAFEIIKDDWQYPEREQEGLPLRTIKEVKLYDVSPVTYPASPTTDVDVARAVRSLKEAMGVEGEAETITDVLALREDEPTSEPEPEPGQDHSETTWQPDPLLYVI